MRGEDVHPGDLIAGKYRVRAILSRNPCLVLDAFHTEFDQRVTIKLLSAAIADDKEVERFRREARTLAKLESEHVARVLDVGTEPDGSFYLVRQHLDGVDLAAHVESAGPLPIEEAVLYVLQAAEAVAETHANGIILRELQPGHLVLTQRAGGSPLVKVVDFGTAKLMRDSAAPNVAGSLTATAMFGMTPYSSPELVRKAKSVDVRTDVWSLGAILYYLLSGRPPFIGDIATMMLRIAREDVVPLSELRQGLPPELDRVIDWAMAKDVDGRFVNVHAFAHQLAAFAPQEGQILIQRIGQITHAAKHRKRVAAAPTAQPASAPRTRPPPPARSGKAPPPPASAPGGLLVGRHVGSGDAAVEAMQFRNEDSVTRVLPVDVPKILPTATRARTLESPQSSMQSEPAPAQAAPAHAEADQSSFDPYSQPLPKPSRPPNIPGFPSTGSADHPESRVAPSSGAIVSESASASARGFAPDNSGPRAALLAARPAQEDPNRRMWLGVLATLAVVLPVILILLIVGRSDKSSNDGQVESPRAESREPAKVEPQPPADQRLAAKEPQKPVEIARVDDLPAEPGPSTAKTAPAPAEEPTVAKELPTAPTQPTAPTAPPTAKIEPKKPEPKKEPEKSTDKSSESSASGSKGTLLAIATGGSCAFSVNGSPKGMSSTLRVQLAPGPYTVTCKPASGAAKSRSTKIKAGETSMLTFKL